MVKFVDHVDHIQWVCHAENIAKNAALLGSVFGCELAGPVHREDLGFILYVDWSSGLEIIAPMAGRTDFNQQFHDHLERCGEGVQSIVFGVRDIARHRERMLALGFGASEIFGEDDSAPWAGQLKLQEFIVGQKVMGTQLVFGEIEYRDGLVTVE